MRSQGIHIADHPQRTLEPLRPVLQAWLTCIERYVQVWPHDVPYWYNERANVGLLAAAAWQAGMVALEEYPSLKRPRIPLANPNHGRNDLHLSNGMHQYCIEAKYGRGNLRKLQHLQPLQRLMQHASQDVQLLQESGIQVAATFFSPYCADHSASAQEVADYVQAVQQLPGCHAHAWWAADPHPECYASDPLPAEGDAPGQDLPADASMPSTAAATRYYYPLISLVLQTHE